MHTQVFRHASNLLAPSCPSSTPSAPLAPVQRCPSASSSSCCSAPFLHKHSHQHASTRVCAAEKKGPEVVPASQLPPPHPKAMKALEKLGMQDANIRALLDRLGSVGFVVMGSNTEMNMFIAQQMAKRISYFCTSTLRILAGMHKLDVKTATREDLVRKLGSEQKLVEEEAGVLHGLRKEKRIVVATIADAATGSHATYRDLWGFFLVKLDVPDAAQAQGSPTPAQQVQQANSEVKIEMRKGKGFSDIKATPEQQAKAVVDQFIIRMVNFMNSTPNVVNRKREYVHYGCRGDWPEIKPPEWAPIMDAFGREPPKIVDIPNPESGSPQPEQPQQSEVQASQQTIDVQPS